MIHRSNKKIFCVFFIILFQLIYAQKITSINIDSENTISESSLSSLDNHFIGKSFSISELDSLKNYISVLFINEGYFESILNNSKIIFYSDSTNVSIKLSYKSGKPTYINSIKTSAENDNKLFWIKKITDNGKGKIYSQTNINLFINSILNEFEKKGYSFTKININSVSLEKQKAEIFLNIIPGLKSVIDKIIVAGNKSTEVDVIIRELPFQVGDNFTESKLFEARDNLIKLNYFKNVSVPQYIVLSDGTGIVEINVEEKNTNNFDGIVGYVPKSKTEDGYFTGFVNISMRNLFGTGRAAAIRWKKYNRNSQELELKYKEPWLFNFPFSIGFQLYQKKQDTTYVKRYLSSELSYLISSNMSIGLILETESVIPTIKENPVFTVYNSSLFTTGINFLVDTRDDILSPKSGIYINNIYKYSKKSINGPKEFIQNITDKNIQIQKFEFDFEFYQTFSEKHTLALKLGAREIRSDLTESSDNYYIGGNNTLRGYREKQFSGTRVLWSNLEYRYILENRSFLFLFFDTGYFNIEENLSAGINGISEILNGYGGGISLETSLGLMSISYALGKDDTFTQGKIHIGLINEF